MAASSIARRPVAELDHVLLPRRLVDVDRVVAQEVDHRLDLGQQPHPVAHQLGQRPQHGLGRLAVGEERPGPLEELVGVERPDVLGVEVLQLLHVEERRRRGDVVEPEQLDDLGQRAGSRPRRAGPSRAGPGS